MGMFGMTVWVFRMTIWVGGFQLPKPKVFLNLFQERDDSVRTVQNEIVRIRYNKIEKQLDK